ncbi:MAG: glutathione S-transferase family protein [Hyphomicrobiaceae bacterium]
MLKLFYAPGTCALATRIALEEAGAAYDATRLNLRSGDQRQADYLNVNPKGRVPALVTERGILTEVPAILAFIAQTWPEANLAPIDDPFSFAEVQAFNTYLCATVHVAHAHGIRGNRWANEASSIEDMKNKVPETMAACFDLIETEMFQGPWVMGENYSIADAYLFTVSGWLASDSVDIAQYPKVAKQRQRMQARPAVKAALEKDAA